MAGNPAGRRYHACFGGGDKVQVFDVWDSQASFDAFGQTLMPILQSLGADPGQPMVAPLHNVIVPPAKRPAARAKARRAAPRKAPKKAKKAARRKK